MVILCKGGESGLGKHHISFMTPVKKTPDASTWTIALPTLAYPHQKSIGKNIMNNVCVPRFAVIEK